MKYKWWEKTVEYCFVLKYLKELSAMPLDGNEEKAGDTLIFNKDAKTIIIEFKKDKGTLSSEKSKFNEWQSSKEEIKKTYPKSDFHLLCFGSLGTKNRLELNFINYWNLDHENPVLIQFQDALEKYINKNGKKNAELKNYIEKLEAHKKGKNGSGDGGIIDSLEHCLIIGMDSHNNLTTISLKEYKEVQKKNEKNLDSENKATNNTSTPSRPFRPR